MIQVVDAQGNPTEAYRALRDPRDKFQFVTEALLIETTKPKSQQNIAVISDLHAERRFQRATATNLFPVWDATHNLSLFDIKGRKQLYSPNPIQLELHNLAEKHRALNIPLKLLIPKSRRHGVTEGVSKIIYPMIARAHNLKALVLAQVEPDAVEIFRDKYKYVHDNDPFAPETKKCNDTMLDFLNTGSQIAVRSAGGRKGIGRGSGHIALHFSECAHFAGNPRDVAALISSLVAGMPKIDIGDDGVARRVFSLVFAESTGNGQKGWFYEKCMRVNAGEQEDRVSGEEGDDNDISGWQIVFFPWYRRWNATMEFDNPRQKLSFVKSLDEEELLLKTEYDLTLEQINWRRHTLKNDIEGINASERSKMFKQEHPATLLQCFQPAGGMAFPVDVVDSLHQKAKEPETVGKLISPIRMFDRRNDHRIHNTPTPKFIDDPDGWYFELEPPEPGEEYCIGIDMAKGDIRGDWTAAAVLARHKKRFVAYIHGKIGPDAMVEPARLLAKRYNDAWINPEENYGAHLIEELKRSDRRHNLYWRHTSRGSASTQVQKAYGFNTNEYSKKHLIDLTNHYLEVSPGIFTVKKMLAEMLTFEQAMTDSGKVHYPGAPPNSGVHDDLVDAGMLALVCDYDMKRLGKGPGDDPKAPAGPEQGNTRNLRERLDEMSAPVTYYEEF